MFYIYNTEGLQFRGPLEILEKQRKVERSDRAGQLTFKDHLPQDMSGGPHAKAAAAYQKAINRENMVEPLVHVHQIMSSPVSTISPQHTIEQAWSALTEKKIGQLVVTKEVNTVLGVLSEKDILKHITIDGNIVNVAKELLISDAIDSEVITTDSMSDIRRVARVMAYFHINAIPVLHDENLVGIVTRGDILRGFAENPRLNLWA